MVVPDVDNIAILSVQDETRHKVDWPGCSRESRFILTTLLFRAADDPEWADELANDVADIQERERLLVVIEALLVQVVQQVEPLALVMMG